MARSLTVSIPLRTVSELNAHEHWRGRHARNKQQQGIVLALLRTHWGVKPPIGPFVLYLTRLAPRRLDPDNLAASMKHVQDAVADWLGIDDGDPENRWMYQQESSKVYAVQVEIELPIEIPMHGVFREPVFKKVAG